MMPIRPHGKVPDPVPIDLSAPSSAHVDMSPDLIPGPAKALDVVLRDFGIDPTELGIDPATLVTGELSTVDDDGYVHFDEPSVEWSTEDTPVTLESLHETLGQLVRAVQVIGEQQQWVTDKVAELGPLFAQLDHMFAGASSPVDILKGLMGMRKKVIDNDGT